jgi:GT2 family glycosyltransferase
MGGVPFWPLLVHSTLSDTVEAVIPCQPTVFWHRDLYESVGPLDESLRLAMDYDYWLRAILSGYRFRYVDQSLAVYRLHPVSKSCQRWYGGRDQFREEWRIVARRHFRKLTLAQRLRGRLFHLGTAAKVWSNGNLRRDRAALRRRGSEIAVTQALAPEIGLRDALRIVGRRSFADPMLVLTRFYWGALRRIVRKC